MKKSESVNKSGSFKTVNVLAITIAHHIHDIYTSFLPALQPTIVDFFGLNNRLFGLLSVFQRIPTLFNPFIGVLAERVRIRYLMIAAPTLTAISMSLMGNVNSFTSLAVLVFISGFSSAIFHVPTPVMMKHVSGSKPGVGMGFYMFGGEFARTVGPIVAIGAVDLWGFDGLFRLIPAGILSSLILFVRFRKVDLSKDFNKNKSHEGSHLIVLKRYLPLLISIALVTLVRGGMKSFFTYYLVGFLKSQGWNPWLAGIGLSVVYLTGTVGSFFAGIASDYIGRRTVLLGSSIISPLLVFAFIYSNGSMPFVYLGVIGFFLLAPTPVFLSIVNTIKSKHVTFLNGTYMTTNFLMSSVATMLAGFGLDLLDVKFNDPFLTLKISAIIALFAIPLVIIITKKK